MLALSRNRMSDQDVSVSANSSKDRIENANAAPGEADSEAPSRVSFAHARLASVPNLRALLFDRAENPVVFRSARQECLSRDQLKDFMDLDVRTIIDLRSCHEYYLTNGDRLLDRFYKVFEVQVPKKAKKFLATAPKTTQVSLNYTDEDLEVLRSHVSDEGLQAQGRRRLLIPVCNSQYMKKMAANEGNRAQTFVRGVADLATLFKFGFLTRQLVEHFNAKGQWRLLVTYMEYGANALCAALKLMTVPENLPVMINCHMGKDRTGVLAALLLSVIGVPREQIVKDFTKSEDGIQPVRDQVRDYMREQGMFWKEEFLHAFPDDIKMALEFVDAKYGDVAAFLDVNGFTHEEQQQLRDNLLAGSAVLATAATATAATIA